MEFYKHTILHFKDTSSSSAAAQRKVTFEYTSGSATAAHWKVDKNASDASSQDSKTFSNKRKFIDLERGTCKKHNSIYQLTTPTKRNKFTIKNISPGCYLCVEEDLRPGMNPHVGTGYVTDSIDKKF